MLDGVEGPPTSTIRNLLELPPFVMEVIDCSAMPQDVDRPKIRKTHRLQNLHEGLPVGVDVEIEDFSPVANLLCCKQNADGLGSNMTC